MNKSERIEAVKAKYLQAKEASDLSQKGSRRASNPLDAFNRAEAEQILKDQMKDGQTVVPIDLFEFWNANGLKTDWNHALDKTERYFEILVLSQIAPDEMQNVKGIYGRETTEALRSHFKRGKHFVIEANKEKNLAFLSIDISDLVNPEVTD